MELKEYKKLEFIPANRLQNPPRGMVEHIKDSWWVNCPERGLAFYRRGKRDPLCPQCNKDERIAKAVAAKVWSGLEVSFVPSVFLPIDVRHY